MTVLVALVLTILAFVFITYPFFKQRSRSVDSIENEELRELQSKRDTTYSMLKELEFDQQSGILTQEDYRELETRYKRKAIAILRNIDGLESGTGVEEQIEKQVRELRQGRGQFCPQCGARYDESDRFCARCGASLNKGEAS